MKPDDPEFQRQFVEWEKENNAALTHVEARFDKNVSLCEMPLCKNHKASWAMKVQIPPKATPEVRERIESNAMFGCLSRGALLCACCDITVTLQISTINEREFEKGSHKTIVFNHKAMLSFPEALVRDPICVLQGIDMMPQVQQLAKKAMDRVDALPAQPKTLADLNNDEFIDMRIDVENIEHLPIEITRLTEKEN